MLTGDAQAGDPTLMYELVLSGEVHSVHVGRVRKMPVEALAAYVDALGNSEDAAVVS